MPILVPSRQYYKNMKVSGKIKTLASVLAVAALLCATGEPAAARWWEKHDEGWFFYREKEITNSQEEETKEKEAVAPPAAIGGGQAPLFTEVMKKRGEELLSVALENPTIENVRAYMMHNQAMMALSKNFSLMWQKVLMAYPELLSGAFTSDSDKDIYYRQTAVAKKEALAWLAEKAGLLFIYDTECPYCLRQARHLRAFLEEYPFFVVKAVTVNGQVLPKFPASLPDNGISVRLGVTEHPAIFLLFPPGRFERIRSGLVTAEELRDKLLWYIMASEENNGTEGADTGWPDSNRFAPLTPY